MPAQITFVCGFLRWAILYATNTVFFMCFSCYPRVYILSAADADFGSAEEDQFIEITCDSTVHSEDDRSVVCC